MENVNKTIYQVCNWKAPKPTQTKLVYVINRKPQMAALLFGRPFDEPAQFHSTPHSIAMLAQIFQLLFASAISM